MRTAGSCGEMTENVLGEAGAEIIQHFGLWRTKSGFSRPRLQQHQRQADVSTFLFLLLTNMMSARLEEQPTWRASGPCNRLRQFIWLHLDYHSLASNAAEPRYKPVGNLIR